MKFAISSLLLAGILSLLFACESGPSTPTDGSAPPFFADLYIRYIAPQQQYTASASFRQGDSLATANSLLLPKPVLFQAEEMKARQLPQDITRYRVDKTGAYQERSTFTYTLPDGQRTPFELALPPIDSFEVIGGKASLEKGMELYLHGTPLQEGERLVLLFTNAANEAESITLPGPQFEDTIKLHPLRLRKLSPGPHSLYLVRKVSRDTQLAKVRVRSAVEFYSGLQPFDVVKR